MATDPRDPPAEGGHPVFVTFKLGEARLAEDVLTRAGVEYEVRVEVLGRTLFGFKRNGVVFSVEAVAFASAAAALTAAGLGAGVMPDPPGIPDAHST